MLLFRLIEWCAARPAGLPAGGLAASIARTSPSSGAQTGGRREKDGRRMREEKNSVKTESKQRRIRRKREERRGEKTDKRGNISLNESLLAVSVSQSGGVGVLPQALHPSSLCTPPPTPSFCSVCVCVCKGRGAGMTGKH